MRVKRSENIMMFWRLDPATAGIRYSCISETLLQNPYGPTAADQSCDILSVQTLKIITILFRIENLNGNADWPSSGLESSE